MSSFFFIMIREGLKKIEFSITSEGRSYGIHFLFILYMGSKKCECNANFFFFFLALRPGAQEILMFVRPFVRPFVRFKLG